MRVDQLVSAVRAVEVPVLVCLRSSCDHVTEAGRFEPCKMTGTYGCNTAIRRSKGKGEAIQIQTWTGPEGSRSLRLSDFKTVGT